MTRARCSRCAAITKSWRIVACLVVCSACAGCVCVAGAEHVRLGSGAQVGYVPTNKVCKQ